MAKYLTDIIRKVTEKGYENIMGREPINRAKTIKQLQELGFRAIPTVATYDMGLQYDCICHDGAGTGLGNILSWPAYVFRKIDALKWTTIRGKIIDGTVCIGDLQGTDLFPFVDSILLNSSKAENKSLSILLGDLKGFPENFDTVFYCLFDDVDWDYDRPEFYETKEEMISAFEEKYCIYAEWETMDDEELEMWLERSKDDLAQFPVNVLDDNT